jgi:hypothetical protein
VGNRPAVHVNYFAHGYACLDQPYVLAGTAVPDWLSVVGRHARVRSKHALPFAGDADTPLAAIARGIVRHHVDDEWFHRTTAFAELSWQFTGQIRGLLLGGDDLRPSFVGHILVEILLDACLIADDPSSLERYYAALESVDPVQIETAVGRMAMRRADHLATFVTLFLRERFLCDYIDDDKLCYRLNQVMRRVRLPPLPGDFGRLLPDARRMVRLRQTELLTNP